MRANQEKGFSVSGCRVLDHPTPRKLWRGEIIAPPDPREGESEPAILLFEAVEAASDIVRRGLFSVRGNSRRGIWLRLEVLAHILFPVDRTDGALARRLRVTKQAVSRVKVHLHTVLPELRRGRR